MVKAASLLKEADALLREGGGEEREQLPQHGSTSTEIRGESQKTSREIDLPVETYGNGRSVTPREEFSELFVYRPGSATRRKVSSSFLSRSKKSRKCPVWRQVFTCLASRSESSTPSGMLR